MPNLLEDLVIDRVDLVDNGANSAAFIQFYKRKEQTENMDIAEILAKMSPEQARAVQAEIDELKAEAARRQAGLDEAKKKVDKAAEDLKASNDALAKANEELEASKKAEAGKKATFDEDETLKAMPEAARTVFLKMRAQKDAAEEEVRKAKEAEATANAVAKAAELKALPVPTESLTSILKKSPEMFDVLSAISKAIDGTVLSEVGKRGEGRSDDAWGQIEKAAEEIATAENITKQKAVGEVIKRKPELYKAYLEGGAN